MRNDLALIKKARQVDNPHTMIDYNMVSLENALPWVPNHLASQVYPELSHHSPGEMEYEEKSTSYLHSKGFSSDPEGCVGMAG